MIVRRCVDCGGIFIARDPQHLSDAEAAQLAAGMIKRGLDTPEKALVVHELIDLLAPTRPRADA